MWCRKAPDQPWCLDITISEGDQKCWIYRRDPTLRVPLENAVLRSERGIPYLAPELQLLFKSKNNRTHDDRDATEVIPIPRCRAATSASRPAPQRAPVAGPVRHVTIDADPARGRLPFGDLKSSAFVPCGSPATSRRSSGTPVAFGSRWGADGGVRPHTRGRSAPSGRLPLMKLSDCAESAIFRVLPERRSFWPTLVTAVVGTSGEVLPVIQRMGVDFDNRHQIAQAVEYRIDVARRMSDRPLSGQRDFGAGPEHRGNS